MKILSFDVGIINLAYCIIENISDNIKICEWDIINLDTERKICEYILSNNKICNKYASHKIENMYLCKNHNDVNYKIKYNKELEKFNKIIILDNSQRCIYKENNIICNKKSKYTIEIVGSLCSIHSKNYISNKKKELEDNSKIIELPKIIEDKTSKCQYKICDKKSFNCIENNGYYCKPHSKIILNNIEKSISSKKINKHNSNKIYLKTLLNNLFTIIDNKKSFMDVDIVLIENQPTFLNPTMKTISSSLYSYFLIRGIIDKKDQSIIKDVRFISPTNKLKLGNANKIIKNKKKIENDRKIYKLTKELGVSICRAIISNSEKIILDNSKKKDDLCDSFLQAFFFIFNEKEIPILYKEILDSIILKNNEKLFKNK
jgi:hypothetical protein